MLPVNASLIYIHNPALITITIIIKPTNIGTSTLTSNTKIDSITSKIIIPITTNAIVPKAILLAVLNQLVFSFYRLLVPHQCI